MHLAQPTHFLIEAVHPPRVIAYGIAVLVSLCYGLESGNALGNMLAWLIALMVYPHFIFQLNRSCFNHATGARNMMFIDAVVVVLLVHYNNYHLFATALFVACLVMSCSIIARPILAARCCLLVLALMVISLQSGASIDYVRRPMTELLCSVFLIIYSGYIAFRGFRVAVELGLGRREAKQARVVEQNLINRLGRYLSPQLVPAIAMDDHCTRRKRLTIFFSDIAGFTHLMDHLDEQAMTRVLNEYLDQMARIAIRHGGTVDKFMGDGLMVFYGDPESNGASEDAFSCVQMAIEMRERLEHLRKRWRNSGIPATVHIRIGIHTGYCAVGNFGSEARMDYTAIGNAVNIASRLEGRAPLDGILISESTYGLIGKRLNCCAHGNLRLKGLSGPVKVFLVQGVQRLSLDAKALVPDTKAMRLLR